MINHKNILLGGLLVALIGGAVYEPLTAIGVSIALVSFLFD